MKTRRYLDHPLLRRYTLTTPSSFLLIITHNQNQKVDLVFFWHPQALHFISEDKFFLILPPLPTTVSDPRETEE